MIRFLKNVKSDSKQGIELSSFDINAICYNIEVSKYITLSFDKLVHIIYNQLNEICTNQTKADGIKSVDEREDIFKYNSKKLNNLTILKAEVEGIFNDLNKTHGL